MKKNIYLFMLLILLSSWSIYAEEGNNCIRGDVDEDGKVNIQDVVSLVKQSLDGTELSKCADMNSDGNINILDIVIVVKQIVGGNEETVIDPNDFVSVWKITKDDKKITIPTVPGLHYNYTIDWGDKSDIEHITTGDNPFHEYSDQFFEGKETVNVTITISITDIEDGAFPRIYFNYNKEIKDKIIAIPSLGAVGWTSFENAFLGCTNLGKIYGGDTSKVTSMRMMFHSAKNAEPETSHWDTSKVKTMWNMFGQAEKANPDVKNWDTSSVTTFAGMFTEAKSAKPNTSEWVTDSVTGAVFKAMFVNATSANPDVRSWNTSGATNMNQIFQGASSADPDTGDWDVSNVVWMGNIFLGSGISNANYKKFLIMAADTCTGGNPCDNTKVDITTVPAKAEDEAAMAARKILIGKENGWLIKDDSEEFPIDNVDKIDPNDFVSVWKTSEDNETVTIPTTGTGYKYNIDWGDPNDTNDDGLIESDTGPSHGYSVAGEYTITISITDIEDGAFPRIKFAGSGEQSKIIAIPSLGAVGWTSFDQAFDGCSNLVEIYGGDLSKVTITYRMFRGATKAVPDTTNWDVSSVTNMREMFYRA